MPKLRPEWHLPYQQIRITHLPPPPVLYRRMLLAMLPIRTQHTISLKRSEKRSIGKKGGKVVLEKEHPIKGRAREQCSETKVRVLVNEVEIRAPERENILQHMRKGTVTTVTIRDGVTGLTISMIVGTMLNCGKGGRLRNTGALRREWTA